MNKKTLLFAFFLTSCCTLNLFSQSCDPWITQAYKELYNRAPSSSECNIYNYNKGSWNGYDQLKGYIRKFNDALPKATKEVMPSLTGDPWIFKIYKELYNRQPNAWELNIQLYNKGSWSSYDNLKKYIQDYQQSSSNNGLSVATAPYNGNVLVGFYLTGQQVATNVVAPGGGNVVAAGGANVIAAGDAKVVAAGGANVVAPGGANIIVNSSMAGVRIGDKYVGQSGTTRVIPTSGSAAMIIK